MRRDFLPIDDFQIDEILHVLDLAQELKAKFKEKADYKPFKNHTLAMIFANSSVRTCISFETRF